MKRVVSVIMPTYKGGKMIEKAIKSILSQTYNNIELIIVDDNGFGTPDQKKTESIVRGFNDERIVYIPHKKNRNGAAARNTGLKRSIGDFVCFHDDDDLMLPYRIEKCVEILARDNSYGGVLTDVLCCDEKMVPIRIVKVRKDGNCTRELFVDGMFLGSGSNIFVKREIAEKIGGFDESFVRHQDIEFMIRFYKISKTKSLGDIGIIKSKNDIINIPNYPKFRKNEEYFIDKFKEDVEHLDELDKDKFYSDVDYWLRLSKALYGGGMRGLRIKDRITVVIKKTKIDNYKLFSFMIRAIRRKMSRKLNIPKNTMAFLEDYR